MIRLRRGSERGQADFGWLKAKYSFSFAGYHDPDQMGFRVLRVMNEDRIAGGGGFPTHPHRDMEILTYVISGGLEHRDSLGTGSVIQAGEFQRMSAGSGVTHSEANHSASEALHLFQIWILPEGRNLEPGYEQRSFDDRQDTLRLVAARDGRDGALTIHQDVEIYSSLLSAGKSLEHSLAPGRHAWVQVVAGRVRLNDQSLEAGDGAALSEETLLTLSADQDAEVLVFDLP
ncbi:MAG: pirin family protein [Planctomycetes bacterium]|nr:pirin family protein [Planctomycetota bacterium]